MNGLLEKSLLNGRSPTAFATTKALCVAVSYMVAQPSDLDLSLLKMPQTWLLVVVSIFNTPLYAYIAKHENPAMTLPFIVACSQALRLLWMSLFFQYDPWTPKRLVGVVLAIAGGLCLG